MANISYIKSNNIDVFPAGFRNQYMSGKLTTEKNITNIALTSSNVDNNNQFYILPSDPPQTDGDACKYVLKIQGYQFIVLKSDLPIGGANMYAFIRTRPIPNDDRNEIKEVLGEATDIQATHDEQLDDGTTESNFYGLGFCSKDEFQTIKSAIAAKLNNHCYGIQITNEVGELIITKPSIDLIPNPSIADNGKIIKIENGEYVLAPESGGGGGNDPRIPTPSLSNQLLESTKDGTYKIINSTDVFKNMLPAGTKAGDALVLKDPNSKDVEWKTIQGGGGDDPRLSLYTKDETVPKITTENIDTWNNGTGKDSRLKNFAYPPSAENDGYVPFIPNPDGHNNQILHVINGQYALDTVADKAVKNVQVFYAQSDSSTIAPISGWQVQAPEWLEGQYMWQKTIITYMDGSTNENEAVPTCISGATGNSGAQGPQGDPGTPGEQGTAGRGIISTIPEYYISDKELSPHNDEWRTEYPKENDPIWKTNHYVFTRSKINWTSDPTPTYTDAQLQVPINTANKIAQQALDNEAALKGNIYYQETTEIDGGKIRADTITSVQMAANSITAHEITAETLNLGGWRHNSDTIFKDGTGLATGNTEYTEALAADPNKQIRIYAGSNKNDYDTLLSPSAKYEPYAEKHGLTWQEVEDGIIKKTIDEEEVRAEYYLTDIGTSKFAVTEGGGVYAKLGKIGGWQIGKTSLTAQGKDSSEFVGLSSAPATESRAIWAGNLDSVAAPFSVSNAGFLTAHKVDIKGKVTADAGKIGEWNIQNGRLAGGKGINAVRLDASSTSAPAFWAGSEDSSQAKFKIEKNGSFYAETGHIGANVIIDSHLTTSGLAVMSGSDTLLYAESADKQVAIGKNAPRITNMVTIGQFLVDNNSMYFTNNNFSSTSFLDATFFLCPGGAKKQYPMEDNDPRIGARLYFGVNAPKGLSGIDYIKINGLNDVRPSLVFSNDGYIGAGGSQRLTFEIAPRPSFSGIVFADIKVDDSSTVNKQLHFELMNGKQVLVLSDDIW